MPDDKEAAAWAEEKVRELGGAPVILNLGASKPLNRWPAERFGDSTGRMDQLSGL